MQARLRKMQIVFSAMNKYDTKAFGARVKARRLELGLSQAQVAAKVGIDRASVSQWETGSTKKVDADHLFLAAEALDCSPEWLLYGRETARLQIPPSLVEIYPDWQTLAPSQRAEIRDRIAQMAEHNRELLAQLK